MTDSLRQRHADLQHRVDVLTGILEDLPRSSDSTEVLLEEILRARISAEYFGRLLQKDQP